MTTKKPVLKYLIFSIICLIVILFVVFAYPKTPKLTGESQFYKYLDSQIPLLMKKYDVKGASVVVIHNSRVEYIKGFGYADAEGKVPITGNTLFQAASISKTLTAWGVMNLVEDRLIDLDAPVSRYLSRWQLPPSKFNLDEVTIRRMLSHSSGIANVGGYAGVESLSEVQSLEQSLTSPVDADNKGVRVIYEPGSKYVYSGGAYTLLQLVIEEVTGQSFEDYMKSAILQPLGMSESGYELTPSSDYNVAVVYNKNGELSKPRYFAAKAAAGLYTSSSDLASLALAMMLTGDDSQSNAVLSEATLREMYEPQSGLPRLMPYGLGYMLQLLPSSGLSEVSHTGSNQPGWNSVIATLPEKGEGLVILTNSPGGLQLRQTLEGNWLYWATGEVSIAYRLNKLVNALILMVPVWLIGILLMSLVQKIIKKTSRI